MSNRNGGTSDMGLICCIYKIMDTVLGLTCPRVRGCPKVSPVLESVSEISQGICDRDVEKMSESLSCPKGVWQEVLGMWMRGVVLGITCFGSAGVSDRDGNSPRVSPVLRTCERQVSKRRNSSGSHLS